jgi:hypothetical protein
MRKLFGLLVVSAFAGMAQNADAPWKRLEFMLGNWTGVAGEKDTPHGAGSGGFSFTSELNGKVIVQRNHAAYDSGVKHDDLMIIYLDPSTDAPRAIFFDTEGHVIRYHLSFPAANRVVFESDGTEAGPKYRLTYWMNGGSMDGKFEVAPPGAEYKPYMSWSSKKN